MIGTKQDKNEIIKKKPAKYFFLPNLKIHMD